MYAHVIFTQVPVYACISLSLYIYIYTHTHILYMHTCIHACMHTCIYAYAPYHAESGRPAKGCRPPECSGCQRPRGVSGRHRRAFTS